MSEQPFRPRPRPTSGDVARAEQARAEAAYARFPRRGNNPYMVGPEPELRTYADPTADKAIAKVDRERGARWGLGL
ncbi:hypothetical protein CRM73_00215 [Kocuria sp. CCUG 69068]|uniref:hypothetical protein n=1 Tax=Kocuria sp. CCUG 69068 TaxID=2043138 RepID=UPI001E2C7B95|nr:hypothetical protein [Kocuria sp. CCUG 69068]